MGRNEVNDVSTVSQHEATSDLVRICQKEDHLLSDDGGLWVTETVGSKTMDKGDHCPQT